MAGATRAATREPEPPATMDIPGVTASSRHALRLQAFGKAYPGSGSPSEVRGPCPISQKVFIALEERGLPYVATYIEEGVEKPQWFMEKNPSGLLPVLRDYKTYIQDSDKIIDHLNDNFPSESAPFKISERDKSEAHKLINKLFQTLNKWLKSQNMDDPEGKEYKEAVRELNGHLSKKGPYLAGDDVTDIDFDLAPKLRHARTLVLHYFDFVLPQDLTAVHRYIELMENRASFMRTNSADNDIIFSWQQKLGLPERVPLMQAV